MKKVLNFNWVANSCPVLSAKALKWVCTVFVFTVGCAVNLETGQTGTRVQRGVLQPNESFTIFALKYPPLAPGDRVAISYGDVTEPCHLSSLENLDGSAELSFICAESGPNRNLLSAMKPTSVSQSFLWLSRGKHLTHLWVNQKLFACQTNSNQSLIECGAGVDVKNITSIRN